MRPTSVQRVATGRPVPDRQPGGAGRRSRCPAHTLGRSAATGMVSRSARPPGRLPGTSGDGRVRASRAPGAHPGRGTPPVVRLIRGPVPGRAARRLRRRRGTGRRVPASAHPPARHLGAGSTSRRRGGHDRDLGRAGVGELGSSPHERPVSTVLVAPGNAGNRALRLPLARGLVARGHAVLLLEHRGYGGNPGSPNEAGLAADALAARDHLESRSEVDADRIVHLGESLGSAVAARLSAEREPLAVVLRSPFPSWPTSGVASCPSSRSGSSCATASPPATTSHRCRHRSWWWPVTGTGRCHTNCRARWPRPQGPGSSTCATRITTTARCSTARRTSMRSTLRPRPPGAGA